MTGVGRDTEAFRNGIVVEDKNSVVTGLNDSIYVDRKINVDRPCAIWHSALT